MGCKIEDIKDENLQALIQQYGAKEGLVKFLDQKVFADNEVGFRLKTVNIVTDNLSKINNWFKQLGNTDKFWQKLQQDLQIPKEQLELLKESDGKTIEEKLASFVANYSYTVEINTGEKAVSYEFPKNQSFSNFITDDKRYYSKETEDFGYDFFEDDKKITFEEFQKARDKAFDNNKRIRITVPSDFYSSLTVLGGANYKESEIATPVITPNIKGHAQFATNNGIGWFRSDEQTLKTGFDVVGDSNEEFFKTLKENINKPNFYTTKTRRILELQSDLFQKGRDNKELVNNNITDGDYLYNNEGLTQGEEMGLEDKPSQDIIGKRLGEVNKRSKSNENQFLQLLNKDNNWVTFFVKSIIQDSAKKGYEKVLFPSGNTSVKIESNGTGINTIEEAKNRNQNNLANTGIFYETTVINTLKKQGYRPSLITDEYGNTWNEIEIDPVFANAVIAFDLGIEGEFPFIKESTSRIESGEKTITVRSKRYNSGVYKAGDGSIKVDQQGLYDINEYLELTGMSKTEFRHEFIGNEDIKEEHIKKFMEGDYKLWVYKVSPNVAQDLGTESSQYKNEIDRLKDVVSRLEHLVKATSDRDKKQYFRDKIKRTNEYIEFLSNPDNQEDYKLLQLVNVLINQAEDLVNNGNNHLAQQYVNFFQDLLPKNSSSPEIEEKVRVIEKRIKDLNEKVLKLDTIIIAKNSKARDLLDINGEAVPFVKDKPMASMLLDASTSNNPWVRELYRVVSTSFNKTILKLNFVKSEISKLHKDVVKFQSGVPKDQLYDFMLQTNERGEKTGYTIDKNNWKYYQDKIKNYYNPVSGSRKELKDYVKWLRDNHNIIIDQEAFKSYEKNRVDYIMSQPVSLDESKYKDEESLQNAINNKRLDWAGRVKAKIDPNTFVKLLNKPLHTAKDLDFIQEYLNPGVWKSFNGKPIITYENSNPEYKDDKYDKLNGLDDSNPLKRFFTYYTNSVKSARMESNDWEQDSHLSLNYVPELKSEANLYKQFSDWVKESFTELPDKPSSYLKDPITGEPLMVISDSGMLTGSVPAKYKNYNLNEVLDSYISGHVSKREKSKVEDSAKAILNIIKNQKEYELDKFGNIQMQNGNPVIVESKSKEGFNMAAYHLESMLYNKHHEKGGSLDKLYYDSVTQQEIDELKAIEERSEEEEKRLQELLKKGTVATVKKGVSAFMSYVATKALAFNPFSGIAEMLQSTSSLYIEAAGSKFFNSNDITEAFGKALKLSNPAGVILPSGIAKKLESETIKTEADKLFSNFPIINNYGLDIKKGFFSNTFIGFETSEKLTKGTLILAYLKNKKVVGKDGLTYYLGQELKYNEQGVAYLDDRFEDDFGLESPLRNEVVNELSALSKKMLSRDSSRDPIQLNKPYWGQLLGQFRSGWMFEGFTRRWSSGYDDAILGKQRGYFHNVFLSEGKWDIKKAMNILYTAQFNPSKLPGMYGMQDLDVRNVKKALRELQIWMSLATMYLTISLLAGGDDDEEDAFLNKTSNFLLNLSYRGSRDLSFYINPKSTVEIFDSPFAAMSSVKQLMQFGTAIVTTPFDPYVYDDTEREQLKVIKSGVKLVPLYSGANSTYKKWMED